MRAARALDFCVRMLDGRPGAKGRNLHAGNARGLRDRSGRRRRRRSTAGGVAPLREGRRRARQDSLPLLLESHQNGGRQHPQLLRELGRVAIRLGLRVRLEE